MAETKHPLCRTLIAVLLLSAWLVAWIGVSAQSLPTLDGVVSDDTGQLDAAAINASAKKLQDLGIKPLIVFSRSGQGFADAPDLAKAAAQQYGLTTANGSLDPKLLAIVVILNSRRSGLFYGDAVRPALDIGGGSGTIADQARNKYLNTNLASGDYTKAFTSAIDFTASQIANYQNPPPTATPLAPVINNTNISNNFDFGWIGWVLGGIALLIALFIIVPLVWRQYRKGQAAAARLRALREQMLQARNVAADMITNLEFPADPNEQIQYRFLALALAKERPQQLANITGQYKAIYLRLADALARYNVLNERQFTTEQELTAGVAEYGQVQATVKEASDYIQTLAQTGKSVETQVNAAPGEADSAKKAIAAATNELAQFAAAAPDLKLPTAEQVTLQASQNLVRAQNALQANPPRPLETYDAARVAGEQATALRTAIGALQHAYAGLLQGRTRLANARREGFKLVRSDADFAQALEQLSEAAKHLPSGDAKTINDAIQRATQAAQGASENIGIAIAQHAANEKALKALKAAGEELKQYIQQGATAFDAVDEYAPSSWQDIQGNGTEAQKRADEAYTLWQEATQLNNAGPDGEQDFAGATGRIERANGLIEQGRTLVAAIRDRLQNLQESQRTAQAEITAAEKDIAAGRAFVQQYDPDITPQPVNTLDAAAEQLQRAREEVAQPKPDWIQVVRLARSANDAADKALADARGQEASMEALRQRVQTGTQQATASVSRAQNFAQVHKNDITDQTVAFNITAARTSLEKLQSALQGLQRGGVEDVALAKQLTAAVEASAQAQQAADAAYGQAYTQFQVMDNLRRQTAEVLQKAQTTVDQAANYVRDNGDVLSQAPIDYLHKAIALMPRWRNGEDADAATLKVIQQTALRAQKEAQLAMQSASADVQSYNDRVQAQEAAANAARAAAVLSVLASAGSGSRRSSGSSWGGSWGSGGSSGGGGSSSGGWGGGGSSSGSWGGGGSSSGSWGGGGSSSGGW